MNKTKQTSDTNRMIITGEVLKKDFVKKNGVSTGHGELYFRMSVQDYFIKFCESNVERKDLEPYVQEDSLETLSKIVTVTLEVEVRNGNWDICADDPQEMQSRIGSYIVVTKILPPPN